jgi:hypothetical protein
MPYDFWEVPKKRDMGGGFKKSIFAVTSFMDDPLASTNYGVQIVNKVENVLVNTYIFDLIDNGVYVVYALYSRICQLLPFEISTTH